MKNPIKKRGQLTVFMLLGIVIIAVFAFAFYIGSKSTKKKINAEQEIITKDFLNSVSVQEYVKSCIDRTAKDALLLLGRQGGVIYSSQVKSTDFPVKNLQKTESLYCMPIFPHTVSTVTNDVFYMVYKPRLFSDDSQLYPYGFERVNLTANVADYPNIRRPLMFEEIRPLCSTNGSNAFELGNEIGYSQANNTCIFNYRYSNSIQFFLQEYIMQNITKCVDFNKISEVYGYRISASEPKVDILFGDEDIAVIVNYPLSITIRDEEKIKKIAAYYSIIPVRLKKIYFSIRRILYEESNNIFFDMVSDSRSLLENCREQSWAIPRNYAPVKCLYDGMEINRIENPSSGNPACTGNSAFADIFNITDYNSTIDGQPYSFFFAVENRRPALDLINETEVGDDSTDFDIIVTAGEEIVIEPKGYDPDEDNTQPNSKLMHSTYRYGGWRQTTYEIYDASSIACTPPKYECSKTEPIANLPEDKKWMHYSNFDGRTAKITTSQEDAGYHEVNVSVYDNGGLYDFQVVRILVKAKPEPNIEVNIGDSTGTVYHYADSSGIPITDYSIEDPIILDASTSAQGFDGIQSYSWYEGNTLLGAGEKLYLPLSDVLITIENIQQKYSGMGWHADETKTIKLILNENNPATRAETTIPITLKKCLPHVSPNPSEINPFLLTHFCCVDEDADGIYDYAAAGTSCNDKTEYVVGAKMSPPKTSTETNDLFEVKSIGYCRSGRGNICDISSPTEHNVLQCPDNPLEDCKGPPIEFKDNPTILPSPYDNRPFDPSIDCNVYPLRKTFEQAFELTNNGVCKIEQGCYLLNKYTVSQWSCDSNGDCVYPKQFDENCDGCYFYDGPSNTWTKGGDSYCPPEAIGAECRYCTNACSNGICRCTTYTLRDTDYDSWDDRCETPNCIGNGCCMLNNIFPDNCGNEGCLEGSQAYIDNNCP
ncbi:hypothetical protein JXA85_08235 [Candidatus Woesearchaeota archaeon]|nr:hypothetical protein [Candidatus Woesearchaeota archaeon]